MRGKLAPGIKLALLPKKTRGATVQMAMTIRVGDEKSLRERGAAGTFAARMLMRGTTTRTLQQSQDELDRLNAQLNVDNGPGVVSASLEVPRESLPAALNPRDRDAMFGSYAIYAPQNSKRLTTAFDEEMARVVMEGFKAEEIAEAKRGWLQERQVARASDRELATLLAEHANLGRTMAWEGELERLVLALGNDEIQAA